MAKEMSYGIIPLCNRDGAWQVLLIQHCAGHWGFPKGHAEKGEVPQQAASRELNEETGLSVVSYLSEVPLAEKYYFFSRGRRVEKEVTYFLAETQGELVLQHDEIKAAKWVPLSEAQKHITFPAAREICEQAVRMLKKT